MTVQHDRRQSDAWREEIRRDVDALKKSVGENTEITKTIGGKLDMHIARTSPVTAAWDKIEPGIRVLGGIGTAGEWCIEKWKPIVIMSVAAKVLISGGGWHDAWAIFLRI